MLCPNCNNMLADNVSVCDKCGYIFNNQPSFSQMTYNDPQPLDNQQPIGQQPYNQQSMNQPNTINQNTSANKISVLSIISLILSVLGCTAIVGGILAIIDLVKNDGRKKVLSIISLCVCVIWIVISIILIGSSGKSQSTTKKSSKTTTKTTTSESKNDKDDKEDKDEADEDSEEEVVEIDPETTIFNVGDTFTYDDVSLTFTEFGEYTDYESYDKPDSGKKYVYAEFYVVNNSDDSKSISWGDFEGYADDVNVDEYYGIDLLSLELSPGKYGSGFIAYVIPDDTEMTNFEMEYKYDYWDDKHATFAGSGDGTPVVADNKDIEVSGDSDIEMFTVGETFESEKGISVEYVENGEYTNFDSWSKPKDGYKVIYLTFNFVNNSDDDEYISDWDFECYADNENMDEYYYMDDAGFSLTLSSGRKGSGTVAYEVPENASKITIEYKDNIWSDELVGFEY